MRRFQEEIVWSSGKFTVDDAGRVWRSNTRAENKAGEYLQVKVMINGIRYYTCAHRLVWLVKNGRIPIGMVVNHKNGVKHDNRPENLEFVSAKENCIHANREGLKDQRGQKNPAAKISDTDVARIRLRYASGGITQEELGREYGVTFQAISKIVRGDRRKSQLGRTGDYSSRRKSEILRDRMGKFVGKKAAGRLLDGVLHDEYPEV
jgi:DNA-binding XRE family transcriptional regulator